MLPLSVFAYALASISCQESFELCQPRSHRRREVERRVARLGSEECSFFSSVVPLGRSCTSWTARRVCGTAEVSLICLKAFNSWSPLAVNTTSPGRPPLRSPSPLSPSSGAVAHWDESIPASGRHSEHNCEDVFDVITWVGHPLF